MSRTSTSTACGPSRRNDRELAVAIADRAHGVDRVEDEVEEHLLELHPVALHSRQSLGELGPQHDAVAPDFSSAASSITCATLRLTSTRSLRGACRFTSARICR